jgi:membrane protease YdiL (CAAX protease family)
MRWKVETLRPWLYMAAMFGSQLAALAIVAAVWTFSPNFRPWIETPVGTFSVTVFGGLAAFGAVMLFATARLDFLSLFQFQSIRRGLSYSAPAIGFALGLAGVCLTRIRMENFADNYPLMRPFVHLSGPQRYLLVIVFLVGPIFEEIIMRGFLYRAFRKNYGITRSVSVVVLVAMLTHPGVMAASIWLFLFLGIFQAILSLILEKTGNLWNCITCHCAYNATVASAWLLGSSS